jgi:hypothetical protein
MPSLTIHQLIYATLPKGVRVKDIGHQKVGNNHKIVVWYFVDIDATIGERMNYYFRVFPTGYIFTDFDPTQAGVKHFTVLIGGDVWHVMCDADPENPVLC